jgi:hypothetical protein
LGEAARQAWLQRCPACVQATGFVLHLILTRADIVRTLTVVLVPNTASSSAIAKGSSLHEQTKAATQRGNANRR